MPNAAVDALLHFLDLAFETSRWHSLLGNLAAVSPAEWDWRPSPGGRSVRDIVQHVGGCKWMYENHAFGDGTLRWDDPLVDGDGTLDDVASAVEWLRRAHGRLRASVAALDDADLTKPRPANWGEPCETRWLVAVTIEHDLYHAGEINHLRALQQGNDRWAHGAG
jgi:uncharacterized damage-inducible protein DinB